MAYRFLSKITMEELQINSENAQRTHHTKFQQKMIEIKEEGKKRKELTKNENFRIINDNEKDK
jgi:hypothetical protein